MQLEINYIVCKEGKSASWGIDPEGDMDLREFELEMFTDV